MQTLHVDYSTVGTMTFETTVYLPFLYKQDIITWLLIHGLTWNTGAKRDLCTDRRAITLHVNKSISSLYPVALSLQA